MDCLTALEVFQHVRLLREEDALQKRWALQIAAASQAGGEVFESVAESITELAQVGQRRRDALELVSDKDRIAMIGTAFKSPRWRKTATGRKWIHWMESRGVTESQAREAAEHRRQEVISDPFFNQ